MLGELYCAGVYLCSCELNRMKMGGEKHVLRVNAGACVAGSRVPADLWKRHRRRREKRDGDPTCEIWMSVKKDLMNLR